MTDSNTPWLNRLAIFALLAGLVIGGIALAAPLGVWFGLWEFQTGFQILFGQAFSAVSWGYWIAIGAAVIAVLLFVLARSFGATNGARLTTIALIGAVAAALAYAVPNSYRTGDDIPPIHDITTDWNDPPQFVDVLPLRADAANTAVYGGGPNETPESLAAQQRGAYPDIVPQLFDEPPEALFARVAEAVRALGWELVAEVPTEGRIEATDTTFWFRFKVDIVIRIRPTSDGSVLDARSVSRVGRGDAGKNAERLRQFFATL